jgi:hypothetical protein
LIVRNGLVESITESRLKPLAEAFTVMARSINRGEQPTQETLASFRVVSDRGSLSYDANDYSKA